MKQRYHSILAALAAAALVGCGGGQGESASKQTPESSTALSTSAVTPNSVEGPMAGVASSWQGNPTVDGDGQALMTDDAAPVALDPRRRTLAVTGSTTVEASYNFDSAFTSLGPQWWVNYWGTGTPSYEAARETRSGYFYAGVSAQRFKLNAVPSGGGTHLVVGHPFASGQSYQASVYLRADTNTDVIVQLRRDASPWNSFGEQRVTVGTAWTRVDVSGTYSWTDPGSLRIIPVTLGTNLYIDEAVISRVAATDPTPTATVVVNQTFETAFTGIAPGWSLNTWGGTPVYEAARETRTGYTYSGSASQRLRLVSVPAGGGAHLIYPYAFASGKTYRSSLYLRADSPMDLLLQMRRDAWPWTAFGEQKVTIGTGWQRVDVEGLYQWGDMGSLRIAPITLGVNLYIDDVTISEVSTTTTTPTTPTTLQLAPPYLRLVVVDPNNAAASDTGPGTAAQPLRTISAAMNRLLPGDDVVVAAGTYREMILVPSRTWGTAATRIRALNPGTATVKGSDPVSGFAVGSNGILSMAWSGEEPQQVYEGGVPLKQIGGTVWGGYPLVTTELTGLHSGEGGVWPGRINGGVAQLVTGSFTFDYYGKRLYIKPLGAATSSAVFEVSTRRHGFKAESASGLTVSGLVFEHSNTTTTYRQGAVKLQGSNSSLENLTVRNMDGECVELVGTNIALRSSKLDRCGQVGIAGFGDGLRVDGNTVTNANTRGFNKWWEAGGMKFIGVGALQNATISNNTVAYSAGDGIWLDTKCSNNLISGNTVAYNAGFGIHYEASTTATIRGNRAYGNDLRGIYLLESSYSLIESNAVFGNVMEGIGIVNGFRSATDSSLLPKGNRVMSNTLAWNDYKRNWVQVVMPGFSFPSSADRNVFIAQDLYPRYSMGFVSSTNPAYQRLANWRSATGYDLASTEALGAIPSTIASAIAAKRLLTDAELPASLLTPGVR